MIYDKMEDCFSSLETKVEYALNNTDLKEFFKGLDEIEGSLLITGSGGSAIVGTYLAKVLSAKRKMITRFVYPRDLLYMDLNGYKSVLSVSYSGHNIGVDAIFENDLNKYLLTGNKRGNVRNIVYKMMDEVSYVSISATIVPLSLIFLYYHNDIDLIKEIISSETAFSSGNNAFEVMSGYETLTAATLLESSIIESGMATCIVHDKYNYCHGRINITKNNPSDLIFFKMNNELDDMLYENLKNHYHNIITIERRYEDDLINDFYASLISLKLIRNIAREHHIDISDMDELIDNDILYRFNGLMK